jgi:hypothetical protein
MFNRIDLKSKQVVIPALVISSFSLIAYLYYRKNNQDDDKKGDENSNTTTNIVNNENNLYPPTTTDRRPLRYRKNRLNKSYAGFTNVIDFQELREGVKTQIEARFSKKVEDTTIPIDLPRLLPNTRIVDVSGKVLWSKNENENQATSVYNFLSELSTGVFNLYKPSFQRYEEYTKDMENAYPPQLKKYLLDIEGDYPGVFNVLRCMTQGFIVPSVTYLKKLFSVAKYDFLDIGGWKYTILPTVDNIVVTSKRWERSTPEDFRFCWILSITFNREGTKFLSCEMFITKIKFTREDTTDHQKKLIMDTIDDIYRPKQKNV